MREFSAEITASLGGDAVAAGVECVGSGAMPSAFAVSDLAAAAVGAAGGGIAQLVSACGGPAQPVIVERRLASLWFAWSIKPEGWTIPAAWDPIAGDYASADGWIRLHTNAPHHRAAALAVLNVPSERARVENAVRQWHSDALETAIVSQGGCAATMRSTEAWAAHPQGDAMRREPLIEIRSTEEFAAPTKWRADPTRPLRGLRVLDLTRVLAGPVATRFLAGFGADVLRIDPPGWDEPGVVPDVTLGKRCARLNLRVSTDRAQFERLLSEADVFVHGYRADALDGLGFGFGTRRRVRPGLVDVSLNAYGWSGPWRNRRGFDSLVQMSAGIAHAGMLVFGQERPTPLPVQALDHAAGYLMAAAVIHGIARRVETGRGFEARTSLARVAQLLTSGPAGDVNAQFFPPTTDDWSTDIESTAFGPAYRLRPPLRVGSIEMRWDLPAANLGSSPAQW